MNTEYTIYVKVSNKAGLQSSVITESISTKSMTNPVIVEESKEQKSGYSYAISKTMKITYSDTNITEPSHYFKSSVSATVPSGVVEATCGSGVTPGECEENTTTIITANTWYKSSGNEASVTYNENGTLYALTSDSTNVSGTGVYTINKIDKSEPVASLAVGTIKTDRVTLTATCTDESGITKYEFSKDGTNWVSNGTTSAYVFTGLTKETNYNFKTRCTNGSGLASEASSESSTLGMTNPTIVQTSQNPDNSEYAASRVIKITYIETNIDNPVYYFKSSVSATVPAGVISATCGTGTNPGQCTSSSETTLIANTWYKTANQTPSVTYTKAGILYALTSDSTNVSGTANYTIAKIDTVAPTIKFSLSGTNSASVTCTDAETSVASAGETWTLSGTSNITKTYTCTDLAGNSVTGSHTYTYSSCVTGANTCSYGCDSTYNSCISGSANTCVGANVTDYNNCTQYRCTLWKSCTLSTECVHAIKDACDSHAGSSCGWEGGVVGGNYSHTIKTSGRQSGCGSETVYGSECNGANSRVCNTYGTKWDSCASTTNTCQGGYVQSNCSSCKSGSNTCKAGFKY